MRWLGAVLLLTGGWGISRRWGERQRRNMEACGSFSFAAQRMEQAIRCERRALRELVFTLSQEQSAAGEFFEHLLRCWQGEERTLGDLWAELAAHSALPEEGVRLWRELGERLDGDAQSVCAACRLTAEGMEGLRQRLAAALPERLRLSMTLSLSAAAMVTVLLL